MRAKHKQGPRLTDGPRCPATTLCGHSQAPLSGRGGPAKVLDFAGQAPGDGPGLDSTLNGSRRKGSIRSGGWLTGH